MKSLFPSLFLLITLAMPAHAQKAEIWQEEEDLFPSKNESWYMYWALGLSGDPIYSGVYREPIERLSFEANRMTVGFDLLGIYIPISTHTLLGGVGNISIDRIYNISHSVNSADGLSVIDDIDYVQINQYQFGASAIHFFGANIGDGFYLRTDLGMALIRPAVENINGDSVPGEIIDLDDADTFGGLLGFGYGLPVSEDTRIMLNINYSFRSNLAVSSNIITAGVGALF